MKIKILIIFAVLILSSCDQLMPKFENTTSKNYTLPDIDTITKITENIYDDKDKIVSTTTVDLDSNCKDFAIQLLKLHIERDINEFKETYKVTWTESEFRNFVKNSNKYSDLDELFSLNQEILCKKWEDYKNPRIPFNNELMLVDTNKKITFVIPKPKNKVKK
ncbi:MAG TPA: hypothetical protein PKD00_01475 [Burkholderiales bacterium]|nr:hypothetical protein [Burkholderiales bacterium]